MPPGRPHAGAVRERRLERRWWPVARWTYRGFDGVKGSNAPILVRLVGWLKVEDPGGRSLGIAPSPAHDRASPKSIHRCRRALDWRPANDAAGWALAHTLADYPAGVDVQLILWKDWQWGGRAGPGWRYTGRKDHDTHLHIETRGWS